ncbi:MAG: hypothetical protein ABEI98_01775 [Halorhabdus sp.]
MDIPDPVRQELGGENILAGVSIGDEDVVCLTPTRTIVYRSEGLISDERVDSYSHEADRLQLSEGRRKSKFLIDYFDETRSLSVPTDHTRDVLTLLLEGMLGAEDVIDADESVVGAFRFSEMTLVVAEKRLVRHIGATVWDDEYEVYPYERLTDLVFEEASVATELVVSIDGRPQRIKIPREDARLVEETIKSAVFEFYDVASFEELRRIVSPEDDGEDESTTVASDELTLGPGIDPLVSDDEEEEELIDATAGIDTTATTQSPSQAADESVAASETEETAERSDSGSAGKTTQQRREATPTTETPDTEALEALVDDADLATEAELQSLREQVGELSTAVKRQNQLLKKQHSAIKQLVEELRDQ